MARYLNRFTRYSSEIEVAFSAIHDSRMNSEILKVISEIVHSKKGSI